MTIETTNLPHNVQTAILNFEEKKAVYMQLQERLGSIHQKLEKHRKSADAMQTQSEQLGIQWRDAFRKNDGELTKEIRAMKNGETEAREFAEEYTHLVNTLTPEFEQCQFETVQAREKHLVLLKELKNIYGDYQFTTSAHVLFSLPEAKPFLMALNHKFFEIHSGKESKVYFDEIPDDDVTDNIKMKMEWQLMKNALKPFFDATGDDPVNDGFAQYQEVEITDIELSSYSPARAQRLMAHGAAAIQ